MIEDFPNCCALVAAGACYELGRFRIQCRPLAITYRHKPTHRHIIVAFMFEGRLRGYDPAGSVTLPKGLTLDSLPKKIAQAWRDHPGTDFPYKVIRADWY